LLEPVLTALKILREGQEHDVPECESGHPELVDQFPVNLPGGAVIVFKGYGRLIPDGAQKAYQFPEADFIRIEMDARFLARKVYLAAVDSRVEPVQVFQDPDTGTAMYLWDAEGNYMVGSILELQQAFRDKGIVQKVEFSLGGPGGDPRCSFQFVVIVQVVCLKNFIDCFTAVATERLIVETNFF
jgi:hypothetical protein